VSIFTRRASLREVYAIKLLHEEQLINHRNRITALENTIGTLRLAQTLRHDWAKELSKTIDVVGIPSYPERKAKKKRK
jgi:hypothetical protein